MSSLSFSKSIAYRYLWTRRSEAFITIISLVSVIGVAVGVMVLNIVMAVMTGFEHELIRKIVDADSHIVVRRLGGVIRESEQLIPQVKAIDGVTSVTPFLMEQALFRTQGKSAGLLLKGIPEESGASRLLQSYLPDGQSVDAIFQPAPFEITRPEGEEDQVLLPGVVIGHELARQMGLVAGQPVSVLSARVSSSPFGLMPRYKRFLVVGAYKSGLVGYETGLAYTSLQNAQTFFRLPGAISGLEVRVDNIYASQTIAKKIQELLAENGAGFYVQDWTDTNKDFLQAIQLERTAYFIVLLLIVVMASFSIVTTLVMIVLEKRRDIAILKTMGATSKDIANIFRIQGTVVAFIGTVLGLVLGYLGCVALQTYGFPIPEKIFQMDELPINLDWRYFAVTALVTMLICYLATVYPARRAAALSAIEALRNE